MLKKTIALITCTTLIVNTFAISATNLKSNIDNSYNSLQNKATNIFNLYKKEEKSIENSLQTGDYLILNYFTGIKIDKLKQDNINSFTNTSNSITNFKYNLYGKIDDLNNKLNANIISTGEYNEGLVNIEAELSGDIVSLENKIKLLGNQLSGNITTFKEELENKLKKYDLEVSKYKIVKGKYDEVINSKKKLEEKLKKLENIQGISYDLLKEKKDEIKKSIKNYFSKYIDDSFQKYIKLDKNMLYFTGNLQTKKEVILGFVENTFNNITNNTIQNYLPEIDTSEIDNQLSGFQITTGIIFNNYNKTLDKLDDLKEKLDKNINTVDSYLEKFGDNTEKDNILKVLKQDIISNFEQANKAVEKDLNESLQNWYNYIQTLEQTEQTSIDEVNKLYHSKIKNPNLKNLNELLYTLKTYETIIKLPVNKEILDSYITDVEEKIEGLKNMEIMMSITNLKNKIINTSIGDKESLAKLKKEVNNLNLPEKFEKYKKELLMEIQIKENLNKLYDNGAIKYYYMKGDLSYKVANILESLYKKYKNEGKEEIFMEKIKKAQEKLEILESSIKNDKRSYYIIIIHNGLLRFLNKINP